MPSRSLAHDQLKTGGMSDLSRRVTGGGNCDGVCTGWGTGIWIAGAPASGTAAAPAASASDQSQGEPESNNAHHA